MMGNDAAKLREGATISAALAQAQSHIGAGRVSDWLLVNQAMIDRFAEITRDEQFIHVDPARAKATPFGGTIAHGFLVLSLLSHLLAPEPVSDDVKMGVNYGFDRIRFLAPVRSGSRIRAAYTLLSAIERGPGQIQMTYDVTIEIEGQEKPAVLATWLIQLFH